jgi:uncharacterized membrane protein
MKDDKTIGDVASSVKDIKVSSIKKVIHNIWKFAVFGFMCFCLFGSILVLVNERPKENFFIVFGAGLVAAFEFFTGKLTAFIFKERT